MILGIYMLLCIFSFLLLIGGVIYAGGWGKVTLLAINIPFLLACAWYAFNIEVVAADSLAATAYPHVYLAAFWSLILLLNIGMLVINILTEGYEKLGRK